MALRLCRSCRSRIQVVYRITSNTSTFRLGSSSSSNKKPPLSHQETPSNTATPPTGGSFDPPPPHVKEVLDALRSYESRYTYRGWHILRYIGLAAVTFGGIAFYFRDSIRQFLSQETSELAQQTMQDKNLQQEVDRITQQTTNTLLNDPNTVQVSVEFIMRLLERDETRAQVVSLLNKVLVDPTTVQALSQLLQDPVTIRQLQSSLNTLLNDPTIRASLNSLVFELLKDPQTQLLLENLVMDLFQRDNVKQSTADFFGAVLRTPQVIDAATATSQDVVANLSSDEHVHKNLAHAGTSSLKRMVIPGFMFRHPKQNDKNNEDVKVIDIEAEASDGDASDEQVVEAAEEAIPNVESFVQDQGQATNTLPAQ